MPFRLTRRGFLGSTALLAALSRAAGAEESTIQGFDETSSNTDAGAVWSPISDRKIRVGIAGYGVCKFGAAFGFQHHPNVEVAAVSDLFPDRCAELARICRCETTYSSMEEMLTDDSLEAVFVATDAPSHARLCIAALERGKHVASAVPAVWGSMEDAEALYDAVKRSGRKYMMFETTAFRDDCYAMRKLYQAGVFGKLVYAEGEYYHLMLEPIDSYQGWRVGLPPQWYPTHSNGYFSCVTGGRFTEVSCVGVPSIVGHLRPENNTYVNPFGTEVAQLKTTDGTARMVVSWDTPGFGGEVGRVRGQQGSMQGITFEGLTEFDPALLKKPPLPPGVEGGGHGGSHGYLCDEFVSAILEDRQPLVDIGLALNMTAAGILAHESAGEGGEWLKVPQWT
ncbi:MAG: gfo/Idh/MocA family oxidoreductase [Candidatus Hydrogenedens sp.]|nr:gfo/Idh/MocA family oxidoreductase [Candidatus Hydrogenedens sp.]